MQKNKRSLFKGGNEFIAIYLDENLDLGSLQNASMNLLYRHKTLSQSNNFISSLEKEKIHSTHSRVQSYPDFRVINCKTKSSII